MAQGASATRATNQSIPNSAYTAISFDAASFDSNGFWSAGAPTRLTVPAGGDGVYIVSTEAHWQASAVGNRGLALHVNGASYEGQVFGPNCGGVGQPFQGFAKQVELVAGDYVEIQAFQDSGGALNVLGSAELSPCLQLTFIGT